MSEDLCNFEDSNEKIIPDVYLNILVSIFSSFPLRIIDNLEAGYIDQAIKCIDQAIDYARANCLTNLEFADIQGFFEIESLLHAPISKSQKLIEFLNHLKELILESPEIIILDMDGTLYDKEIVNCGHVSKLDEEVGKIYQKMFKAYLKLSDQDSLARYNQIFQEQTQGKNTLSGYLATHTGKTRREIIADVWNEIEPRQIINPSKKSDLKEIVMAIRNRGKKLYLVTAAPRVWMEKVIKDLDLGDCFEGENIFTLENFENSKAEIFTQIQDKNSVAFERMLSVGDNFATDIEPADNLNMKTYLVKGPDDLLALEFWLKAF